MLQKLSKLENYRFFSIKQANEKFYYKRKSAPALTLNDFSFAVQRLINSSIYINTKLPIAHGFVFE